MPWLFINIPMCLQLVGGLTILAAKVIEGCFPDMWEVFFPSAQLRLYLSMFSNNTDKQ